MSYPDTDKSYEEYIIAVKELEDSDDIKKEKAKSFSYKPKISIITPVYNTDEKWLKLAIESVINQIYDNWELCIADGGSTKGHVREVLDEYAEKDNRIKVKFLSDNKGISGNSNEALSLATGEFIGFLDHDDELNSYALYEVVALLNERRDLDLIYTDEDKINEAGERVEPHFKPDWAPDTFRSYNYICHFTVIRKKIIDEVGGFRRGFDGSQDYDLILRVTEKAKEIVHIPKILYHWRITASSAAGNVDAKPYAFVAAKKALEDHISRIGLEGEVCDGYFLGSYRIKYKISSPLVSIIIPTKDKVEVLRKCIDSILQCSTYDNYEILIIDNQSMEAETFIYYDELKNNPKIRVISYDKPFNYSAINNYAVSHVRGEYLLFLNNDTEVITPDWIENMLEFAQRNDVGAVGCLLVYPNNIIQHAGVIVGLGGVAAHPFYGFDRDSLGYMGRIKIVQNLSAVTGACLMTKKSIFQQVDGLDENLSYAYNDIDLCLKIREHSYLIVYVPYAQLYHHESLSRGVEDTLEKQLRFGKEIKFFSNRWNSILESGDPYYNPNLTHLSANYSIKGAKELIGKEAQFYAVYSTLWEKDTQMHNMKTELWEKDTQMHNLKTELWDKELYAHNLRIELWERDVQINNFHYMIEKKDELIHNIKFNKNHNLNNEKNMSEIDIAYARVLIISGIEGAPFIYRCLNLKEEFYCLGYHRVDCKHVNEVNPSIDYQNYDVFIMNRIYNSPNITELVNLCRKNGKILVYSTDDLVTDHNIESYLRLDQYMSISELAKCHQDIDWAMNLIKSSDAVMVSTDYLKSQMITFNDNIYVLENALNEKQIKKSQKIMSEFQKKKKDRKETIIGYFSGWPNDHDYDFAAIKEPLYRILDYYNNVKLRIVGYLEVDDEFKALKGKVEQIDFVPFEVLPRFIADVDINIAPLEANPHKRSKSAIKVLEAAVLGVPTIASNLEPYNGVITHREDGMLCSTPEEWFENLKILINDASVRYKMGTNALYKARSEHTTVVRSSKLRDIIDNIIAKKMKNPGFTPLEKATEQPLSKRQEIAKKYIKGNGIEIGALHYPLEVNNEYVNIKYVDRKSVQGLREHYPELKDKDLVTPDIIGDAEDLSAISDSTQDFVIANHLLEHCSNPIKALKEFHRILRRHNSILYIALPNASSKDSYDKKREITSIEHIVNDYFMKDAERRPIDFEHFKEWVASASSMTDTEDILAEAKKLYEMDYSIHYHVFSVDSFLSLVDFIGKELYTKFEVLEQYVNNFEYIFVLKPVYYLQNKLKKIKDILLCPSCYSQLGESHREFICKGCNISYQVVNNKSVVFITDENELKSNYIKRPIFDYDYGPYEQMILKEHPGEVIIEVGSGINTYKASKYENVILLEIFPYSTTDVVCYAERLPFMDSSISGIICNAVLEHVKNPFVVMKEFLRVLKPGGHIKIDNPFLYPYHSSPDHYFNTTISGLKELCKDFIPLEVGVGGHQLPCFSIHEILMNYLRGIGDSNILHRIENMTVKQFTDFLQECKNNHEESHLNGKAIENLAAGVFFVGYKK